MSQTKLPQFPPLGSRRAELLAILLDKRQTVIYSYEMALELYDLDARGWPLSYVFVDFDVQEVSLETHRLPHYSRRLVKLFLHAHSTLMARGHAA